MFTCIYVHICICVYRCEILLPHAPQEGPQTHCCSSLCSRHPISSMTIWGCMQCLKQAKTADLELLARHNHPHRVWCGSGCMRCWAHPRGAGVGWACSTTCRLLTRWKLQTWTGCSRSSRGQTAERLSRRAQPRGQTLRR